MALLKDPRGILTFIIRYLALDVVFLLGLPLSVGADLALYYFFGFSGFFTFIQVLASLSRKFLDHAGDWFIVVIVGAVASDAVVLWWLGWMLGGLFGGSDWGLVANWLPLHFIAAFLAWGLRAIIHAVNPARTAGPRSTGGPADPVGSTDPGDSTSPSSSEDANTPTDCPTDTDPNTDSQ